MGKVSFDVTDVICSNVYTTDYGRDIRDKTYNGKGSSR